MINCLGTVDCLYFIYVGVSYLRTDTRPSPLVDNPAESMVTRKTLVAVSRLCKRKLSVQKVENYVLHYVKSVRYEKECCTQEPLKTRPIDLQRKMNQVQKLFSTGETASAIGRKALKYKKEWLNNRCHFTSQCNLAPFQRFPRSRQDFLGVSNSITLVSMILGMVLNGTVYAPYINI
ncbi:hypothetical protein K501DRAFT_266901 [Backusella circina FSU 941]|nr:hypothetical protein K501DRAFT_266901 [Backusella circina FSU 941]